MKSAWSPCNRSAWPDPRTARQGAAGGSGGSPPAGRWHYPQTPVPGRRQVKQGAPLYQIDSATYQAAVDTAQAQLAKAEAARDDASNKARRGQSLAARGLVSHDSQEDLVTAQKQAEADVGVARAALESARIKLAYTQVKAPISGFVGKSSVTAGALVTANQSGALATIQQLGRFWWTFPRKGWTHCAVNSRIPRRLR
ncbi:MAG: efflux RND transporter periplasmic adaptor subunit [Candidatus Thiothrix singaporensis]|uniref:Efflux RND transporter periplasmic adaptor subunit n=1 Tax=Candidatus Thiothrix singaporensis TaxID=2799669 RepID=A0A7L6ATS9_9GAMM|nr:MAG: efflux RND transporter periplasmic adaptor subunit [Candidatus Thiothrix singaporensis]